MLAVRGIDGFCNTAEEYIFDTGSFTLTNAGMLTCLTEIASNSDAVLIAIVILAPIIIFM